MPVRFDAVDSAYSQWISTRTTPLSAAAVNALAAVDLESAHRDGRSMSLESPVRQPFDKLRLKKPVRAPPGQPPVDADLAADLDAIGGAVDLEEGLQES